MRGPFTLRRSSSWIRPRLDFKQICRDKEIHRLNELNRIVTSKIDVVVERYEEFRHLTNEIQSLEHERKTLAKNIDVRDKAVEVKERLSLLNEKLRVVEDELFSAAISLPNQTDPNSPIGGPEDNQEIERFGPDINLKNSVTDHVLLGKKLGILDFEAGAKVAGSQQYFLKNQGALLELALLQYSIKKCIDRGFSLMLPPDTAYTSIVKACGFSPRSSDGALPVYSIRKDEEPESSSGKALIGTAEIPIAGYYSDSIIDRLPIKIVGFSHCFRPEVGHHTAESRGLYRVHQFSKVELFTLTENSLISSQSIFDEIIDLQKDILSGIDLPCRILNMATGELGASAYRKYDIEAWFPFRKGWGELTSASNCTDFQSRRLAIRYRLAAGQPLAFPHTLNGTACAIPRVIQAILETHQDTHGNVKIPEALQPFMFDGSSLIKVNAK